MARDFSGPSASLSRKEDPDVVGQPAADPTKANQLDGAVAADQPPVTAAGSQPPTAEAPVAEAGPVTEAGPAATAAEGPQPPLEPGGHWRLFYVTLPGCWGG
jgi:hypothetical protein